MKVGGMNYIVCVTYPMFGSFEGEERIRRKGGRGEEEKRGNGYPFCCLKVLINNRREGNRYSSHCLIAG
jgi:hypothetical protein